MLKNKYTSIYVNTEVNGSIIRDRNKIEDKYSWDLTDIYQSDEEAQKIFNELESLVQTFSRYKGTLTESSSKLLECLKFNDSVSIKLGRLFLYAMLKKDIDLGNDDNQILYQSTLLLSSKLEAASAYIRPEIIAIPGNKILQFIKSEQELKVYDHYLSEIIRTKDHILSEDKEELLANSVPVMQVPYETFSLFNNADINFQSFKDKNGEEIKVTHAGYSAAMYAIDREYRENYYKFYYQPFIGFSNTLSSLFNGNIRGSIFNAKARKYTSTRAAALDANNIPLSVYDNLVDSLSENLAPLNRWCSLRKKILGVKEFHAYDTYVTLFPSVKKEYSYEQGKEIVLESLQVLGDEYLSYLTEAFNNRWIDVFETKGKRSGAYSSGTTFGVHPYVLLNWGDQLDDVFTLTHEMGHNMHSYLTEKTQPFPYANYSIFVAEVASTLNEAILLDFLIEQAESKEEKLSLIEKHIANIVTTFYRQTMFAAFEKEVHERAEKSEALTPNQLCEIYGNLHLKYWGSDMYEDVEEKYTWARVPHFYYNFYVYQYATSFAASEILFEKIKTKGQPAVDKYMSLLKAGSSDYPINVLKNTGVDMMSREPILSVTRKMNSLLDKIEDLI